MKLDQQIEKLEEIGIHLNPGVTSSDLLVSFSQAEFESAPFDLILFVYGCEIEQEPWGRFVCDRAWNFDVEAIEDDGSYVEIVKQFHRITGKARTIENLRDRIDLKEESAELCYTVDGEERRYEPRVDNDWADPEVVEAIMNDLRQPGYNFYPKDNGQASIWFYLTETEARKLNTLADDVFGLNRRPWWKVW